MTDPNAPQDPASDQPSGYAPPPPPEQSYAPPPQQSYGSSPATPAYSQPPAAGAPGPFSPLVGRPLTSDETLWSMLSHIGGIVLGFIAPLIVMLTKGNESPYTRYHAVEALNFQITIAIAWVATFILSFLIIGIIFVPVVIIANIAFCIIAGLAANKGETYRYPVTIRLVK